MNYINTTLSVENFTVHAAHKGNGLNIYISEEDRLPVATIRLEHPPGCGSDNAIFAHRIINALERAIKELKGCSQ